MKIKKETAIKILTAMLAVLMLTVCMQSTVFADTDTDYMDPKSITANDGTGAAKQFRTVAGSILAVVQVIAVAVAVIMLIVLAIKYISSAPNDKAEIKKNAIVYVVGAIILFGASGLLQLIKTFAGKAFTSSES